VFDQHARSLLIWVYIGAHTPLNQLNNLVNAFRRRCIAHLPNQMTYGETNHIRLREWDRTSKEGTDENITPNANKRAQDQETAKDGTPNASLNRATQHRNETHLKAVTTSMISKIRIRLVSSSTHGHDTIFQHIDAHISSPTISSIPKL
jgi:hypothetical protein